ncbi:unnamed protein product, partial [Brassica oleracea]
GFVFHGPIASETSSREGEDRRSCESGTRLVIQFRR